MALPVFRIGFSFFLGPRFSLDPDPVLANERSDRIPFSLSIGFSIGVSLFPGLYGFFMLFLYKIYALNYRIE